MQPPAVSVEQPLFIFSSGIASLLREWTSSNSDTNETEESVLMSELSVFQGLNCMLLKKVIREVPHFSGVFRGSCRVAPPLCNYLFVCTPHRHCPISTSFSPMYHRDR